jgi:beta-phosphoglucomutase-like phosphatase (HAD superfamily)
MPIDPCRAALIVYLGVWGAQLRAEEPLSAIDWLSESVSTPVGTEVPSVPEKPKEPPVAKGGALPEAVATTVLGGSSLDAAGLIAPSKSGLPARLWGVGLADEIAVHLTEEKADVLPGLHALFVTILLAEAEPPVDSGGSGRLLMARIDKLLALGALDQAQALIDAADDNGPDLFRRSFDIALLTGAEDRACDRMQAAPDLAPTFPARVFCLARSGDWNAAALTLRTAQALGYISPEQDALMSRFLDPDLYEGEPVPAAPSPVTPLDMRMFKAIGEPLPSMGLPLAFAHDDLGPDTGWKAQLEAAERLARAGVLEPNQFLGIYTEREPAASGGIWDRIDAFQKFEAALDSKDPVRIAQTLPNAWDRMTEAELETTFAALFAKRLMAMNLPDEAGRIAFRVALLSPEFAKAAAERKAEDLTEAFLIGVAQGNIDGIIAPDSLGRAIAPAFTGPPAAPKGSETARLLTEDRYGEAVLTAIDRISQGVQGDLRQVTEGLSTLRAAGLDSMARRTALELMLLERRG